MSSDLFYNEKKYGDVSMALTLSARLRELRISKNLMQDQVAKLVNVDQTTISAYENGTRQPSYEVLVALADLYRVSTDYLLGRTCDRYLDLTGLSEREIHVLSELVAIILKQKDFFLMVDLFICKVSMNQ